MTASVIFFNSIYPQSSDLNMDENSIFFHGHSVDDRGCKAVDFGGKSKMECVCVSYDCEKMEITVGDKSITADQAEKLFNPYINSRKNIVLEATTLGVPELFFAIKSLIDIKINDFIIIYVEPKEYTRTTPTADSFALTEKNVGYKPIPNAIVDLSGEDIEAGVFFLGFEPDRLERAFEEYQMISEKDLKLVFGIPAFQPGWELDSIVPHLEVIKNYSISYCAANDPSSAYDSLEETRKSLTSGNKMFVAPIGTKPCGIASVIFASIYPSQVGLLYDHRKKKSKRSDGVTIWHRYSIKIRN